MQGANDAGGPDRTAGPVVGGIELDLTVLEKPWQVPLVDSSTAGSTTVHHDVREVMCYRR